MWDAFLDPSTLATAIPGCEKLEAVGPGEYKATMKIGVGPVKGTFEGKVRLSDLEPPNRYRMAVEGTGGRASCAATRRWSCPTPTAGPA